MFQFIALAAALFGGGYAAKKMLSKPSNKASTSALSSKPFDEFLEVRSDGLYQFNRSTAISILGWLSSVSLAPVAGVEGVYDLSANADGSPPPKGAGAARELLQHGKKGKVILLSRDVTVVNRPERRAAAVMPGSQEIRSMAGEGGSYAILLVPSEEKVEPTLPPMPGFEGEKDRPIPGAVIIPSEKKDESESMPNDLRRQIDELLKKTDPDGKALEDVEKQLRLGGYEAYADMVAARRVDVRAKEIVFFPDRFFVIPEGHPGAVALAKRLAGDGKKYVDLLAQNPALSALPDGSVVPWTAGQVVRLPTSWRS